METTVIDWGAIAVELGTTMGVWLVVLLATAYNKNRDEFSFTEWLKGSVNRFVVGAVLTVGLVFLNAFSDDLSAVLRLLGFTTEKTTVSFGLSIAVFLLGGMTSATKAEKKEE